MSDFNINSNSVAFTAKTLRNMQFIITHLWEDMERCQAAIATLQRLGYTYHGGELWEKSTANLSTFDIKRIREVITGENQDNVQP